MSQPDISIEEQAEAFKAWKRGEAVEWWMNSCVKWCELISEDTISHGDIIRRKPAPKLRPWRPEEVPVGARIRRKGRNDYCGTILGYSPLGIESTEGTSNEDARLTIRPYQERAESCEYSTDGGKSWLPCGVLE